MASVDDQLRRLIGQLFIVGFHSQTTDESIKKLIHALYYLWYLMAELQQVAKDAGYEHPLTIGIDQENGLVTLIGVRSFSDDPYAVARLAAANLNGLREEGVKHFPGHSDTAVDSHYGLPVIQRSWADMEQYELVPFRRAVAEKVPSVMIAHIAIRDSKLPATLDTGVLRSLRDDLKFTGVVVSDCLEINAIRTEYRGTMKGAVTTLEKSGRLAYASFTDLATVNEHNSQLAARLYAKSTTKNLVVVTTYGPYDFLRDGVIKTYFTIYEPTSSVFRAVVDVLFRATAAQGTFQFNNRLITAVLVHPYYQSKGLGTALLNHARTFLISHNYHTLTVGSTFLRFFPGLPTDIAAEY
ncbi:hypothetical protein GTA08_BOTSDO04817 [Neofusicoccum parvum]|uniref:Uncharacterized protein n=1 Tax=Neofusicoccum parvum TaxID=310453 RepID=A0ACB5SEX6_9PEZI|nr:hypothetical protein GTA08_BOTSDO04817 [Neofusicoccum parvum]